MFPINCAVLNDSDKGKWRMSLQHNFCLISDMWLCKLSHV